MTGSLDDRVRELMSLIDASALDDKRKDRAIELANELAGVDSLTGLLNRHALSKRFEEEISRAKRYNHPLSAIFFDIDDFKSYNDTYLHTQGDMALRHAASLLRRNIRSEDVLSRYGGEEFCLIIPETPLQGAIEIAQNMLHRVRESRVDGYSGSESNGTIEYKPGMNYQKLTASIGVACYPQTTKEAIFLIKDADEAMYKAKKSGRNRIAVFNVPAPTLVE